MWDGWDGLRVSWEKDIDSYFVGEQDTALMGLGLGLGLGLGIFLSSCWLYDFMIVRGYLSMSFLLVWFLF